MGTNFVMNLAGIRLSTKDMETIPFPTTELYIHVTTKTVQAGGILGSLLVAPIATAISGPQNVDALKSRMEAYGRNGIMIGMILGPLMTYAKIRGSDQHAVWDRSYRIRYNRTQMRVDRLTFIGAVAGYAAAKGLNDSGALGAIVGMSSGCILATVLNMMI